MKYFLTNCILSLFTISAFGQTMQASIGTGSAANRVIVYVKPTAAVSGTISTLQFDVAIDATVTPVPSATIIGTPAFGITWNIDPSYVEGAYRHYQFTTATSPSISIASGAETYVMEIQFTGGPSTLNSVYLQTFGFDVSNGYPGGNSGNIIFFCSGAANSVEGQLFYARPGTTVVNNNSYTGPLPSSATLGGIVLPVNWLSFNVIKQGKDGLLNWLVANEDATHYYEVQRCNNNINFTTIATVNKSGTGTYNYTDTGIVNSGASIVYYRIKEVDINGKITYSDTRLLKPGNISKDITVFPNPVQEGFYVNVPFNNTNSNKILLNLVNAAGQLMLSKEITQQQATNYYFDIKNKMLAAGNYNLQVVSGNNIVATKKLYIAIK